MWPFESNQSTDVALDENEFDNPTLHQDMKELPLQNMKTFHQYLWDLLVLCSFLYDQCFIATFEFFTNLGVMEKTYVDRKGARINSCKVVKYFLLH